MPDQLDRSMMIPKRRIPWVRYFFQFTIPLFLTSLKANAQKGKVAITQIETPASCDRPTMGAAYFPRTVELTSTEIIGSVKNHEGKPVPYATITIKDKNWSIQADSSGNFKISNYLLKKHKTLLVSSVGYETLEKKLTDIEMNIKSLNIELVILEPLLLSEVFLDATMTSVIFNTSATNTWVTMGATLTTITEETSPQLPVIQEPTGGLPALELFPNPLSPGAAVNIKCERMEEAYYMTQLLTISGQLILQKEMWIDENARVLNLPMPRLTAGTYFLRMVNKKNGKSRTEKLMIL
jgi:hypothetical protein